MIRRSALALLLFSVVAVPLHADFSAVARMIDDQHGVKRIWIPFLGLARAVVWMVEPEGVHDFQLATFEGADDLDPKWLNEVLRTRAGEGFVPLVQAWSRRSNEWSFIYARPSARTDRLELMILSHDHEDTVLVRVAVDATVIARELKEKPRHVTEMSRR